MTISLWNKQEKKANTRSWSFQLVRGKPWRCIVGPESYCLHDWGIRRRRCIFSSIPSYLPQYRRRLSKDKDRIWINTSIYSETVIVAFFRWPSWVQTPSGYLTITIEMNGAYNNLLCTIVLNWIRVWMKSKRDFNCSEWSNWSRVSSNKMASVALSISGLPRRVKKER